MIQGKTILIDGKELRKQLYSKGLTLTEASRAIGRGKSYLSSCCLEGRIDSFLIDKLERLGLKKENYVITGRKVKKNNNPTASLIRKTILDKYPSLQSFCKAEEIPLSTLSRYLTGQISLPKPYLIALKNFLNNENLPAKLDYEEKEDNTPNEEDRNIYEEIRSLNLKLKADEYRREEIVKELEKINKRLIEAEQHFDVIEQTLYEIQTFIKNNFRPKAVISKDESVIEKWKKA